MAQASHNVRMSTINRPISLLATALFALTACSSAEQPATVATPEIPATPGSMGPNLVAAPDESLVLSWIEPDDEGHRLQFSVFGQDREWSAPRTVTRGDNWFVNWADFPSVVPLSNELWAAHWLASQPAGGYAYDVNIALSTDQGDTWSAPFLPHSDGTPTEHGFVTLFPDSNGVGAVWLDGRKMVNDYDENDVTASGMTLRTGTFGLDEAPIRSALVDDLTCDCCQTDLALTADGPVVVYRDRTTDEIRDIYVSRREYGEWTKGVAVAADNWEIPACPVNGPIIRADGNRVAVAWFTAANDVPLVKAAWSSNAGRTFGEPAIVSTGKPLGHIGATMVAGDDIVISYQESVGNGEAALFLRRISDTGEMSEPYPVPDSDSMFAFSVPQIAHMANDLLIVWTNQVDDLYSIQSAVIPLSELGDLR